MQPKKPVGFTDKEREHWSRIKEFIRENGGWVTSIPDVESVVFECQASSDLPDLLRRKGYGVVPAGHAERLLPISHTVRQAGGVTSVVTQNMVPTQVEVWHFALFVDDE